MLGVGHRQEGTLAESKTLLERVREQLEGSTPGSTEAIRPHRRPVHLEALRRPTFPCRRHGAGRLRRRTFGRLGGIAKRSHPLTEAC